VIAVILSPFDAATIALLGAVFAPPEAIMPRVATTPEPVPTITPRDVALRLYDQGYVTATLPRREEDLAVAIMKAFEGTGTRFSDLPARRADFAAVRQHLELITREAERYGRSLECERYRPAFVAPVGRGGR
jgi:hypothetical protein